MKSHGSQGYSKVQLWEELNNMSAKVESTTDREIQGGRVTVFNNDIAKAVSIIGDVIANP